MVANDKIFPDNKKQNLAEYRKKYYKIWKNRITSQIKSDP